MWTWFTCYLTGRHDYGVWCEPGTIFLRCIHCGKRSGGWAISQLRKPEPAVTHVGPRALDATRTSGPAIAVSRAATQAPAPAKASPRILQFDRIALR